MKLTEISFPSVNNISMTVSRSLGLSQSWSVTPLSHVTSASSQSLVLYHYSLLACSSQCCIQCLITVTCHYSLLACSLHDVLCTALVCSCCRCFVAGMAGLHDVCPLRPWDTHTLVVTIINVLIIAGSYLDGYMGKNTVLVHHCTVLIISVITCTIKENVI